MKTLAELDLLLNELYWHCEHGEHAKAIDKLDALQREGSRQGMSDAAAVLMNGRFLHKDAPDRKWAIEASNAILRERDKREGK